MKTTIADINFRFISIYATICYSDLCTSHYQNTKHRCVRATDLQLHNLQIQRCQCPPPQPLSKPITPPPLNLLIGHFLGLRPSLPHKLKVVKMGDINQNRVKFHKNTTIHEKKIQKFLIVQFQKILSLRRFTGKF